jgi:hypothetical protein
VLAASLALKRQRDVLDVPENDIVHGAGEREIACQWNIGRRHPSRSVAIIAAFRVPGFNGRRIGAQSRRSRQQDQERR